MAAKVDVDKSILVAIYNARPDIGALFCQYMQPDNKTPWCASHDRNQATDDEKAKIITHWWLEVASGDDDPARYDGSLWRYATTIGVANPYPNGQPGASTQQPSTALVPVAQQPQYRAASVPISPSKGAVVMLALVAIFIFITPRRTKRALVPWGRGGTDDQMGMAIGRRSTVRLNPPGFFRGRHDDHALKLVRKLPEEALELPLEVTELPLRPFESKRSLFRRR